MQVDEARSVLTQLKMVTENALEDIERTLGDELTDRKKDILRRLIGSSIGHLQIIRDLLV